MASNRQQKRTDKSWLWFSAIAGLSFVLFIALISSYSSSLRSLEGGEATEDAMSEEMPSPPGRGQSQSSDFPAPKTIPTRFYPPTLKTLIVHLDSATNYFDFILDAGNGESVNPDQLKPQAKELINFFFLGITLPSEDFWVNLNPIETDKITSPRLTATDLGKVLLATDLILKKDGARLTNPQTALGREYWDKVNKELKERGLYNGQIPANNRLWIVPAQAIVEEEEDKVTIVSAKLKVCLESEYFRQQGDNFMLVSSQDPDTEKLQECVSAIMKETVIPEIEQRVNYSQDYAPLRQVYHSLILAEYFKQKYWGKDSLYSRYVNTAHLDGLHSKTEWSKRKLFDAYVSSFQNGEYSFYQNEYDPTQLAMVQKHYFSGGIQLNFTNQPIEIRGKKTSSPVTVEEQGQPQIVKAYFEGVVDEVLEENTSNGRFWAKVFTQDPPWKETNVVVEPWLSEDTPVDETFELAKAKEDENLAEEGRKTASSAIKPQQPTEIGSRVGGVGGIDLDLGGIPLTQEDQAASSEVEREPSSLSYDIEKLENIVRKIIPASEDGTFRETMFLLFGRKEKNVYVINRIVPVEEYLKQTIDRIEPDPRHISDLINTYTQGNHKLLGALHTHPFDLAKIITKPGPSWEDRLGKDILIPKFKDRFVDPPLSIVIEPSVPSDLSMEQGEDFTPKDLSVYFYLPEVDSQTDIKVVKVADFNKWLQNSVPLAQLQQSASSAVEGDLKSVSSSSQKKLRGWIDDPLYQEVSRSTFKDTHMKLLIKTAMNRLGIQADEIQGRIMIGGVGRNFGHLLLVAKSFPNANIIAVDWDVNAMEYLKEQLRQLDINLQSRIQVYSADLRNLEDFIKDQSIELIFYCALLDLYEGKYIKSLRQILVESARVLEPNGIISAGFGLMEKSRQILAELGLENLRTDSGGTTVLFRKKTSIKAEGENEAGSTAQSRQGGASPLKPASSPYQDNTKEDSGLGGIDLRRMEIRVKEE